MQQAAINSDEMNLQELKDTFTNGYKEFADISTAKIGDKTMMDA